ncbi:MAG: arginine repressor [Phycisphaeraceae bacterium]|nr:MAG: arginine repressor [Phycisphaeraceae bacterium]
MAGKSRRRKKIAELIQSGGVRSQLQLRELLLSEGIDATQATISRDLHDLAVSKGPDGYTINNNHVAAPPASEKTVERAIAEHLTDARQAGNLAVLRTGPGHAQALAWQLDRWNEPEIVGTIAGDDTIFIAARDPRRAEQLIKRFRTMAGIES